MKLYTGTVVSIKMDKTAVVEVNRMWTHPKYQKTVRRTKTYLVHDADNQAKVGDSVSFTESRPYSKLKHFALVKIEK